jgi:hypothetical protein
MTIFLLEIDTNILYIHAPEETIVFSSHQRPNNALAGWNAYITILC